MVIYLRKAQVLEGQMFQPLMATSVRVRQPSTDSRISANRLIHMSGRREFQHWPRGQLLSIDLPDAAARLIYPRQKTW